MEIDYVRVHQDSAFSDNDYDFRNGKKLYPNPLVDFMNIELSSKD